MSRLFIEVYLDEDVDVLIAELIRVRGYTALTVLEAGRLGRTDREQLEFARSRWMAILTHNRDHFARLAADCAATGENHSGIIIARRDSPYRIAQRLLALLNAVMADEMMN